MDQFAILAILQARPGKENDVKEFLKSARALALQETGTVNWFAVRLGACAVLLFVRSTSAVTGNSKFYFPTSLSTAERQENLHEARARVRASSGFAPAVSLLGGRWRKVFSIHLSSPSTGGRTRTLQPCRAGFHH